MRMNGDTIHEQLMHKEQHISVIQDSLAKVFTWADEVKLFLGDFELPNDIPLAKVLPGGSCEI